MKKSTSAPKSVKELLYCIHVRMEVEHFSHSTIANYFRSAKELCNYYGKLPDQLNEENLYQFLLYTKNERKLSRATIRIYLQGLRYMYKSIYKRIDIIKDIPFPKRTKFLPVVPSGKEVLALINGAQCLKHRMLIEVMNSAGLRRSELIRLHIDHIDFSNKRIFCKR
ncbi:tyrosine-type recombinase/integrase [Carboxylicivirga linearis]|uniref:Phage integrase N-terminal SAM-like domain-containing protein n=1 Tax=Carboxylicivirga linearis TaxID=1628157 RepID=A0ABS5K195_9BACT|nr:phage integrase N-terminal SAM-like domain-containing protein [Carboxylicivirga linearis]MBS2100835.1 phage integrase N-terminal SAM-like domain-containing protein [Carboxylicivirga linearis]